jgi:hypothetical protein
MEATVNWSAKRTLLVGAYTTMTMEVTQIALRNVEKENIRVPATPARHVRPEKLIPIRITNVVTANLVRKMNIKMEPTVPAVDVWEDLRESRRKRGRATKQSAT